MHRSRSSIVDVPTAGAMRSLGRSYAAHVRPGTVVLLEGPLGSGKTTFVQGLAKGLGIAQPIVSPTFALRKQYRCSPRRPVATLNHLDAYRMETAEELRGLLEEALVEAHGTVWAIEWGGKLRAALPRHVVTLVFSHVASGRKVAGFPTTQASLRTSPPRRPQRRPRPRAGLR